MEVNLHTKLHIATSLDQNYLDGIKSSPYGHLFHFHNLHDALRESSIASMCEGLWVTLHPMVDKNLISHFKNLKFVATPTTGLTHIDLDLLEKRNIKLFSLRNQIDFLKTISATPEFAWGLMLSVWRKIILAANNYQDDTQIRSVFSSYQLSGKQMGLIGFGRISHFLSKYGDAFGMKMCFYDPDVDPEILPKGIFRCESLEQLLQISDVIFIVASVIQSDYYRYPIINSTNIQLIKNGAIVINVSRGVLMDENSIAQSIRNETLYGVGVDVLQREELGSSSLEISPLELARDEGFNVVITPHIAGMCEDALLKCCINIAKQISKDLKNQ